MLDIVIEPHFVRVDKPIPRVVPLKLPFTLLFLINANKSFFISVSDFISSLLVNFSYFFNIDISIWRFHLELLKNVTRSINVWFALLIIFKEFILNCFIYGSIALIASLI